MTSLPLLEGLTSDLLVSIALAILIGVAILGKCLGWFLATAVCSIRATLNLIYWGWFVQEDWWLKGDSEKYIRAGRHLSSLLDQGMPIEDLLRYSTTIELPAGYALHNMVSFIIFGTHAYAPVLLNMIFVFAGAVIVVCLSSKLFHTLSARRALGVIFIFHWTILEWSIFNNTKEILVIFLVLLFFLLVRKLGTVSYTVLTGVRESPVLKQLGLFHLLVKPDELVIGRDTVKSGLITKNLAIGAISLIIIASGIVTTLLWIKNVRYALFYILPLTVLVWLMGLALHASISVVRGSNRRWSFDFGNWKMLLSMVVALVTLVIFLIGRIPAGFLVYLEVDLTMRSVAKFLLTPRPWMLGSEYGFLFPAAVLHWLFLGPSLIGLGLLGSRYKYGGWFAIYFVCMILIYGNTAEVAGPRHRVQIDFVLIIAQFYLAYWLVTPSLRQGRLRWYQDWSG